MISLRRAFPVVLINSVLVFSSQAGPLSPPPGPIAPTSGPEARIEINQENTPGDANSLFKITQPGSYYLAGNIQGVAFKSGIEIGTSNVTLDLMGYRIIGTNFSFEGITADGLAPSRIRIFNGFVSNWERDGGIYLPMGTDHHVFNVSSRNNNGDGILCGDNSLIESCTALQNGDFGIACGASGVIRSCAARENALGGIAAGSGSTITACTATDNMDDGITGGSAAVVSDCVAQGNDGFGITVDDASTVVGCTAESNATRGIFATTACLIDRCTAYSNGTDGLSVMNDCLVTNCVCSDNGQASQIGAGIRATSDGNRIDGNHLTRNDFGAGLGGNDNILIRCTFLTNGMNLQIVSGSHKIGGFWTVTGDPGINAWSNLTD